MEARYDRNVRLFGEEGQEKINNTHVVIAGVGGLGTHVVQQVAHLGPKHVSLIDKEDFEETNANRYVGSINDDIQHTPPKVDIGERVIKSINPEIKVTKINKTVISHEAFSEIIKSDFTFGNFDREGVRFIINELCVAYEKLYIDLASDINTEHPMSFGGRVCCVMDGNACIECLNVLDKEEVQRDLGGPQQDAIRKDIYGVDKDLLNKSGPSVVSINGVIASLAVTEFVVAVTGIRKPVTFSEYRGQLSKVLVNTDKPNEDCYYCKSIRGKRDEADVERYIRNGVGEWL